MENVKKLILDLDEELIREITPVKGFMFRDKDFAIIPMFFFLLIIVVAISNEVLFLNTTEFSEIFPLAILAFVLLYVVYSYYKRWSNINNVKYYFSTKRIIIANSFRMKYRYYSEVNEITLIERASGKGYIIVGEPESVFAGKGINLSEDNFVLDNLENPKEVYKFINSLLKKYK